MFVENLEDRRLLSGSSSGHGSGDAPRAPLPAPSSPAPVVSGTTLTVTGTAGNDRISVTRDGQGRVVVEELVIGPRTSNSYAPDVAMDETGDGRDLRRAAARARGGVGRELLLL